MSWPVQDIQAPKRPAAFGGRKLPASGRSGSVCRGTEPKYRPGQTGHAIQHQPMGHLPCGRHRQPGMPYPMELVVERGDFWPIGWPRWGRRSHRTERSGGKRLPSETSLEKMRRSKCAAVCISEPAGGPADGPPVNLRPYRAYRADSAVVSAHVGPILLVTS